MPAKDFYHDTVKNALVKDGWTITHDPLMLRWGKKDMFIDLGASLLILPNIHQVFFTHFLCPLCLNKKPAVS